MARNVEMCQIGVDSGTIPIIKPSTTKVKSSTSTTTTARTITKTTTKKASTSTIISDSNLPPVAPTNAGASIGVCTGGFSIYPNTAITICNKDSLGSTRQASEIDCTFPFKYNGVWYDVCTNVDRDYYWCSIDTIYENRPAPCAQACPALARIIVADFHDEIHSSCEPNNADLSLVPDQAQIDTILSLINDIRSSVSMPAASMPALRWNTSLARIAQSKSQACNFKTFLNTCKGCALFLNYGVSVNVNEVSFKVEGAGNDVSMDWNTVLSFWAKQKNAFTYGDNADNTYVAFYGQLVKDMTVVVGCGASKCGNSIVAYCDFAIGQYNELVEDYGKPYVTGSDSCSGCSECSNNLCSCNKLCLNFGTLDMQTCTCSCPPYATGDTCQTLICDESDEDYGCGAPDGPFRRDACGYPNAAVQCPFLCNVCQKTLV